MATRREFPNFHRGKSASLLLTPLKRFGSTYQIQTCPWIFSDYHGNELGLWWNMGRVWCESKKGWLRWCRSMVAR